MSKPRPIHNPHRPLFSEPHESEPSFSYENEHFFAGEPTKEELVEDEFHARFGGSGGIHQPNSGSWTSSDRCGDLPTTSNYHRTESASGNLISNVKINSSTNGSSGGGASFWRTANNTVSNSNIQKSGITSGTRPNRVATTINATTQEPAFSSVDIRAQSQNCVWQSSSQEQQDPTFLVRPRSVPNMNNPTTASTTPTSLLASVLSSNESTPSLSSSEQRLPSADTNETAHIRRDDSVLSSASSTSSKTGGGFSSAAAATEKRKKETTKQRNADRRLKWDFLMPSPDSSRLPGGMLDDDDDDDDHVDDEAMSNSAHRGTRMGSEPPSQQAEDAIVEREDLNDMLNGGRPLQLNPNVGPFGGKTSAVGRAAGALTGSTLSSSTIVSSMNSSKRTNSTSFGRGALVGGSSSVGAASLPAPSNNFSSAATTAIIVPSNFAELAHSQSHGASLDRSSSAESTGSLLYGKTPTSGTLLGKTSSLIFPTGVEAGSSISIGAVGSHPAAAAAADSEAAKWKRRKINLALDQVEQVRFRKKKLVLENLGLSAIDIPLKDLCGTTLGNSLHKLSLAGNRLGTIPPKLVQSLPVLKILDLSQCELSQLPTEWNLPKLQILNLSHNRFTEFPEESMLEGIPDLKELNMFGNKIVEIIVPTNPRLLSKLETLNMGYNDLSYLPPELDQLKALRTLKLMNNFLAKIPMRICDMDLQKIDVSSNPVTEPPEETCERGICSMRRYWHCIRMEEQSKQKALEEVSKKLPRKHKKGQPQPSSTAIPAKKSYGAFMKNFAHNLSPASVSASAKTNVLCTGGRKGSDDVGSVHSTSTFASSSIGASNIPSGLHRLVVPAAKHSASFGSASSGSIGESSTPGARTNPSLSHKPGIAQLGTSFLDSSEFSEPLTTEVDVMKSDQDIEVFQPNSSPGVAHADEMLEPQRDQVTVNDTLKVIFVGMAMVGKTSMIKRLIEGEEATIPTIDERTVGVDIYEWEPKQDKRFEHIDSRIQFQDPELAELCGDVDVKFSVWDFAGQHVYHATHELFFSSRALYVLVWDMGATNRETMRRKRSTTDERGAFKLSYDSSDEEDDGENDDSAEKEARRADRALERDIDEKVQFWVDCIQSTAPGSAILPVASFSDYFGRNEAEAKRRCSMLKQRLLRHEERRLEGIRQRLKEYTDHHRADDPAAVRLRKLLCPYTRPKLLFGDDDEDSVVRVSGTQYTGFDCLTEKILNIATGREKGKWRYPIFRGHVGARIPRMRLDVRDAVRTMRGKFKVVEWGYFINQLKDVGLTSVENISDALHFLTNTGELSYFGGIMTSNQGASPCANPFVNEIDIESDKSKIDTDDLCNPKNANLEDAEAEDEVDDDQAVLSIDDTSITAPMTEDGSIGTVEDYTNIGLSHFVFLNPRWLVAAVACILRHDLDSEIKETRRLLESGGKPRRISRGTSFYDTHLNCPVITGEDACMLWQAKHITKKAAERAQACSNDLTMTPFEFLQLLLIRFGVFVPIDLSIEKAFLGGKEYSRSLNPAFSCSLEVANESLREISISSEGSDRPKFFFLPSLLGSCEPSDAWTYKNTDAWKTTLCHSILFPDGVPPGLMERLTATVLSSIHAVANRTETLFVQDDLGQKISTSEGRISLKEVLCWRAAFYVKIGAEVPSPEGRTESIVEIFTHLADRESHLCVGSDYMGVGMRRLIVSGRGQVGDGGRKIWKGGYLLVCKAMHRVMEAYGGVEYEKQGFCPECLSKKAVSEASSWDLPVILAAVTNSETSLRCQHGHRVDTRLVAGPWKSLGKASVEHPMAESSAVTELLRAVVVVGLWDGKNRKVVRVGSGFIVDAKRGLIVTASHTLINIWGDRNYPYGENYYGLRQGKVVIGVIPEDGDSGSNPQAVFRYFAKIVTKDTSLDQGECNLDACVLQITTKLERDVGGNGDECGDVPEILLLNNSKAMKKEQLQALKITEKCELDEQVRILGYNQGGEGLLEPGESLNLIADFARGYVCMKFSNGAVTAIADGSSGHRLDRFKPREEIVVICPTIGGHSGGPCVNQQGEVVGILSRADPAEKQRCYIAPTYEWKALIKVAKNLIPKS